MLFNEIMGGSVCVLCGTVVSAFEVRRYVLYEYVLMENKFER